MPSRLDTRIFRRLLALRYRLQWAKVRSRDGRIAVAVIATLVAAFVAGLLALGGLGAAAVAVRAGRARTVATGVLATAYILAIGISVFLGIGVNGAFSNAALRQYPLAARDRFAARHLTAFLEPGWALWLALYTGIAAGFSALGVAPCWLTLPAALALLATNFLLARALTGCAEWVMTTRAAPLVLAVLALAAIVTPPLIRGEAALRAVARAAMFTPPGIAARIETGGPAAGSLAWLVVLVGWAMLLGWIVFALDRLPAGARTLPGAAASWGGPAERFGGLFGPELGPLVTKMLRYYARSPQVRWNFPFVLPVLVVVPFQLAAEPMDRFLYSLGILGVVGFLCTGAMSLNLFGFDGAGFNRYFLLPVRAATVVRAAMIVAVLPGAVLVAIAVAGWALVPPVPTDARMMVMLVSGGFGGLFASQAFSLAIAVMWPRAARFGVTLGNRLSAAGGLALCGGVAVLVGLPAALRAAGAPRVMRYWFVWPAALAASLAWYAMVERTMSRVFATRRERMVAVIAGSDDPLHHWLIR